MRPDGLGRREFMKLTSTTVVGISLGCHAETGGIGLDEFISSQLTKSRAPGLAACIVKDDQVLWSKGYGWANLSEKVPMTPDTIINIGSISKTVTATAVMQLHESGEFGLDDDVSEYLSYSVRNPRHPDVPITFRQLLTHRSSIKDGPSYSESYACGDPMVSLEEWIREYFAPTGRYYDGEENFHTWEPGTNDPPSRPRAYTNVGFGLLGLLVETMTGSSFSHYCQERVFRPLGMKHTGWFVSEVDTRRHAIPYSLVPDEPAPGFEPRLPRQGVTKENLEPGGYLPHCLYSFYNYPDGLVRTGVQDLSRFLRAFINGGVFDGARILGKETVETMFSEKHYGRGLCWDKRDPDNADAMWGHGGGDPGISTYMAFRPRDGVGAIVFFNLDRPGDAMGHIFERLMEEVE